MAVNVGHFQILPSKGSVHVFQEDCQIDMYGNFLIFAHPPPARLIRPMPNSPYALGEVFVQKLKYLSN